MATCNVPVEAAIKNVVQNSDLTADQKVRAIADTVRDSNELEIIEQLKKINLYLAMALNTEL